MSYFPENSLAEELRETCMQAYNSGTHLKDILSAIKDVLEYFVSLL